ncbi:hypothetical protein [Azospirillum palustre]
MAPAKRGSFRITSSAPGIPQAHTGSTITLINPSADELDPGGFKGGTDLFQVLDRTFPRSDFVILHAFDGSSGKPGLILKSLLRPINKRPSRPHL